MWHADLGVAGEQALSTLSAEESERSAGCRRSAAGLRWGRSRGLLRLIIGHHLGTDPATLRFLSGPNGKPRLQSTGGGALDFSCSHSGDRALYALSTAGEVGVDIECDGERPVSVGLAGRVFGPAEASQPAYSRSLLRINRGSWCAPGAPRGGRQVLLGAGLVDARSALERTFIADLPVEPGAAAALATLGGPCVVSCLAWPAD